MSRSLALRFVFPLLDGLSAVTLTMPADNLVFSMPPNPVGVSRREAIRGQTIEHRRFRFPRPSSAAMPGIARHRSKIQNPKDRRCECQKDRSQSPVPPSHGGRSNEAHEPTNGDGDREERIEGGDGRGVNDHGLEVRTDPPLHRDCQRFKHLLTCAPPDLCSSHYLGLAGPSRAP